ncbi:hypothetical protein BDN67DRAFT_970984 [Paxillus ammoniavirescens]|nr:hypothetical protein BDN67DRAFT_970984 [Paxillus ammoniavirescens]
MPLFHGEWTLLRVYTTCVVHGDISGSNVLIDGNGRACISDFGLLVLLAELGESTYTKSRHVGGALRWIAPELLDDEVLTGIVPYHYIVQSTRVQSAILQREIPLRPRRGLVTDGQCKFME